MSAKKLASVGVKNYCEMRKTGAALTTACQSGTAGAQGFTDGAQAPAGLPLTPPLAIMNRTPT